MANMIKWIVATAAQYAVLKSKDANALYFISDTGEIYKGDKSFTEAVTLVSEFPAKGALGKMYVKESNLEGKVWTGSAWKTVIKPIATSLSDSVACDTAVTGDAIKTYVSNKFTQAVTGKFVEGIAYDKATKDLTYTKNGATQRVAIDGFVTGAKYTGDTGILSFQVEGGEAININLPKDNFVKSGSYDGDTQEIVLTMTQGGEVRIPAVDLVDVYTVGNTATVAMTMDDSNNITANVKVSATGGNALQAKADGLFVAPTDISGKLNKVTAAKADEIITATADGQVKTSGLKAGGATLSASPNATTLATEAAVNAIKTALQTNIDAKFNKANIKTAASASASAASNDHVLSEKAVLTLTEALDAKKVNKTDVAATLNTAAPSTTKVASESAVVAAMSWTVLS